MRTPDEQLSIDRASGGAPVQFNKYVRDDGSYWISSRNDGIDPSDRPKAAPLPKADREYTPEVQAMLDRLKNPEPYVPPAPEDMPEPPADVLPPDSEIVIEKDRRGGRGGRGGGGNRGGNRPDPGFDPYPTGGEGNQSGNSGNGSGNNVKGDGNQLGNRNSQANNNKITTTSTGGQLAIDGDGNTINGNVDLSNDSVNFAEQKFAGLSSNRFLKQLAKKGAFGSRMAGGIASFFPTLD